jgi:hypothetical protein
MDKGDDRQLDDVPIRAFQLSCGGRYSEIGRVALPFAEDVEAALKSAGFTDLDDTRGLRLPPGLLGSAAPAVPSATLDQVRDLVIQISLFIGSGLGTWAVEKVADEIYEGKVRPTLKKMFTRRRRSKELNSSPMTVLFGSWYDTDGVYIGVIADLAPREDPKSIMDLLPEAQRRGLGWISQHGITKPAVIYRIRHGELSNVPTLSDVIPT